jgi:cytochrome b561
MKPARYGRVTALIHWTHGALVLALFGLGWVMVGLPKGADKAQMFVLHKSLGLCALALLALRLLWRMRQKPLFERRDWMDRAAALNQRLLYGLLLATPLFGLVSTAFGKHPLRLFALELPRWFAANDALNTTFAGLHRASGWLLAAAIVAHLLAAAYHAIACDGRIGRMPPLPGSPATEL